jgi:hypothetical protein
MEGDAGEDIGQPSLRIDAIHLGRDDQAVHRCGAFAPAIRTAEQPRFSSQGDAAQATLGGEAEDRAIMAVDESFWPISGA